jgi:ubiquinone biosynthesis protein UbiJ
MARMSSVLDWVGPALRERVVLVVNHLLAAEPQATARLRPHAGRAIRVTVALPGRVAEPAGPADLAFVVTPAGLLEAAESVSAAEGLDVVADGSRPLQATLGLLAGRRPALRIEGDARFAADVAWLIDHVRWEVEEDLARLIGDAPAHQAMRAVRALRQALQPLLGRLADAAGVPPEPSGGTTR